jgi:predicted nucleotidyltransferase
MKLADVEAILRALNDADVRYLIVGGLAVVAHGYVRATVVVDVVLNLERENILRAMNALEQIGYQPLAPVKAAEFADEEKRRIWREEKHMIVFQMRNPNRESTRLDIFVKEPFAFSEELVQAKWEDVAGIKAPVLRLEQLLLMKQESARPQDFADIEQLQLIAENRKNG